MSTATFNRLMSLVRDVINGINGSTPRLVEFVLRSGDIPQCNRRIGELQVVLGSSEKGLRLLDAQLIIKLTIRRKIQAMINRELCKV